MHTTRDKSPVSRTQNHSVAQNNSSEGKNLPAVSVLQQKSEQVADEVATQSQSSENVIIESGKSTSTLPIQRFKVEPATKKSATKQAGFNVIQKKQASVYSTSQPAVVQRVLNDVLDNHNWADGARAAFDTFSENLGHIGWEEDEIETIVPGITPTEFLRLVGVLGQFPLATLIANNYPWNEIRYYETKIGGPRITGFLDEFRHGTHASDTTYLKNQLTGAADNVVAAQPAAGIRNYYKMQELRDTYPDDNIYIGDDSISINNTRLNGIRLSADKIEELSADQLREIVIATRTLNDENASAGDSQTAQRLLTRLGSSGSQRFRYDANADAAKTFLDPLIPPASQVAFQTLWNDSTRGDKLRAYDLYNGYRQLPGGAANLNRQAAQYSMSTNPTSIPNFVNAFEFYVATVKEKMDELSELYDAQVEALMEGGPPTFSYEGVVINVRMDRNAALQEAADRMFPGGGVGASGVRRAVDAEMGGAVLDNARQQEVAAKSQDYDLAVTAANAVGAYQLANTSPRTTAENIQANANAMQFSSISSASYHVLKHYKEMRGHNPRANAATQVTEFLAGARDTIANGTWTYQMNQSSGLKFFFIHNGMRAIVHVGENRQAIIATFMTAG